VLKNVGFTENKSEPRLLSKWDEDGIILIGVYVNDQTGGFSLKVTKHLTDYLSCRVLENESRNEILILQPHLINNLKDKFEEVVAQKRDYKTPGTPRFRSF
jgi:hypothetical protein